MFRLEKIFQKDDYFFINITIFFKCFVVLLSIYIFSILESNSIFDLLNYDIYKSSKYFYLSLYLSIFYFFFSSIFKEMNKRYIAIFLSFLLNDIIPLLITLPFTLYIFFIFKLDFNIDINTSYLLILIMCNLFITRKFLDGLYRNLMNNNLIQRNIMLVGSFESIEKILKEKKDKINIYKCCLIKSDNSNSLEKARMSFKIPVFTDESEMRIILEYHELGQIWILDNEKKDLVNFFLDLVIKFSVDIIIINLKDNFDNSSRSLFDNLINNKYTFSNYQTSKFYGFNLFNKIILDKILSIVLLILLFPIFIISIIFIYIEDGFPLFYTEQKAGWDGRRFNHHKLRTKKKNTLGTVKSIINKNEMMPLKSGKIIRKLHFDEIPQLFNILKGEMSIVGPRPHVLKDDITYSNVFKNFLKRNKTFPGLTGWAQIHGYRGSKPTNAHMKKRMEYDLWYMNNWSLWLDIYIIFRTFIIVFTSPNK